MGSVQTEEPGVRTSRAATCVQEAGERVDAEVRAEAREFGTKGPMAQRRHAILKDWLASASILPR